MSIEQEALALEYTEYLIVDECPHLMYTVLLVQD
jgi:hypothetical protein